MLKILLTFFLSYSALALETDNYLVWDRDLKDSSDKINQLFSEKINLVVNRLNNLSRPVSCREVTFKIAHEFKTYPPFKIFIEDWLIQHLTAEEIFPLNMNYIKESIYQNSYGKLFEKIPLSPNIQVKGIYFGTDKLSHFTSTSRSYLKKYLKLTDKGVSEEEATRKSIDLGILKETTILGLKAIGVYSYGDLEANYQGFRFYRNICLNEENSFLTLNDKGKWMIDHLPDIKDYVSPYWDESFNLSYRSSRNWKKTSKVIARKYCSLFLDERVQERFNYYRQILKTSFSMDYISELKRNQSSRVPDPDQFQSLEKLCQ